MSYAIYTSGLVFGAILLIVCPSFAFGSSTILMKSREMIPVQVSNLYELSYATLGRKSIFLVSAMAVVVKTGYTTIYFILFSGNAAALCQRFLPES